VLEAAVHVTGRIGQLALGQLRAVVYDASE
jgi:hypothetical protein